MSDLQRPSLIYLKGFLFLICGLLSFTVILAKSPDWPMFLLLSLCVWSFCRFYYFAFYVIQHYVDADYRFTGLGDFVCYCLRRKP
ncbi:MAG: hypothetical protein R3C59_02955 [Planctomycetaceae bacterium]